MASLPEHLMPVPAGRDPMPREAIADHQRDRILTSAIDVFAKRGYQSTTIDNLVAGARVGVGGFYALFHGKQDCFLRAYDRVIASAWDRVAEEVPADRPWPGQADAAPRALLELVASEPHSARIAIVEVQTTGRTRSPATRRRWSGSRRCCAAAARRAIRCGVAGEARGRDRHRRRLAPASAVVTGEIEGIEEMLPELLEIVVSPYVGDDLSHTRVA